MISSASSRQGQRQRRCVGYGAESSDDAGNACQDEQQVNGVAGSRQRHNSCDKPQ